MGGAAHPSPTGDPRISSYAAPGTLLVGKYRVERMLGRGGMAVVVAAKHLQLREIVAVKLLHPHVLANPRAIERFLREARVAMRLRGDHVARVYDVGALDDNTPFVVMECLDGSDLGALLRQRGRLKLKDAVDYVLQACEAIAEAHALGVVHRDLKPANLFLTTRVDGTPCVKVLDFGVSKTLVEFVEEDAEAEWGPLRPAGGPGAADLLDETAPPSMPSTALAALLPSIPLPVAVLESLDTAPPRETEISGQRRVQEGMTMTHTFLGSPRYVAPEQIKSARDADVRADIWALGVILQELVNGTPPFEGDTLEEISTAILTKPPAPITVRGASDLEPVLARCLAKDRAARFPDVRSLAAALAPLASPDGKSSAARIVRMVSVSGRAAAAAGSSPGERRGFPWRWAAIAAAPLIVGVGVVVAGAGRGASGTSVDARTSATRLPPAAVHPALASPVDLAPLPAAQGAPADAPAPAVAAADAESGRPDAGSPARLRPPKPASHPASTPRAARSADPLGVEGGFLFDKRN